MWFFIFILVQIGLIQCVQQNGNEKIPKKAKEVFKSKLDRDSSSSQSDDQDSKFLREKFEEQEELCDCGYVPDFRLNELRDLNDAVTITETGTSLTNQTDPSKIYRSQYSRKRKYIPASPEADYSDEYEDEEYEEFPRRKKREVTGNFRIVGGNRPPTARPWIGFLTTFGFYCGSSLLNSRYIMTAAHCICGTTKPATACDEHVTIEDYPAMKTEIVVSLGVTEIKDWDGVEKPKNGKNYWAIDLYVHPARVRDEKNRRENPDYPVGTYDIAIIKLNKAVTFSDKIRPICLYHRLLGQYSQVVIAGFGKQMYYDKNGVKCWTNEEEPNPFSPCKTSFTYKDKTYKDTCVRNAAMPISSLCKHFLDQRKFPEELNYIYLYVEKNGTIEKCNRPGVGKYGWCEISKGESEDTNHDYGYCSSKCHEVPPKKILKETVLDVLSPTECEDLTGDLSNAANTTIEFCAAKRVVSILKSGSYTLRKNGYVSVETSESKRNFYGGRSTCQGDSGGALWIWKQDNSGKLRAYQVGIVSRGVGCAWANRPGMYTFTPSYLNWIYNIISDGKCRRSSDYGGPPKKYSEDDTKEPLKSYKKDYKKESHKIYKNDYEKEPHKIYKNDYEKEPPKIYKNDYEKEPPKIYKNDYEKEPQKIYKNDYEKEPQKIYKNDYEKEPQKIYKNDYEKEPPKIYKNDYEKEPPKIYKNDYEKEPQKFYKNEYEREPINKYDKEDKKRPNKNYDHLANNYINERESDYKNKHKNRPSNYKEHFDLED